MSSTNIVSEYLNMLPNEERDTLETIRKQIHELIPEVEERLSRGCSIFLLQGGNEQLDSVPLKTHLSFFIMEGECIGTTSGRRYPNTTNSSTVIKFSPENPTRRRYH